LSILNDIEKIRSLDPGNMYNKVFDLPEQLEDAIRIAKEWTINPDDFSGIKNIVVVGMGGSAIGGDLVRSFLNTKLLVPLQVCRTYQLPEYVDDETLVIASSYSGNTEETIAALEDALDRKALVAAISTGGLVNDIASLNAIPIAIIPGGMPPRAALGYSFAPLLIFLDKIGLIKNAFQELTMMVEKIKSFRDNYIEDVILEKNMAKKLAQRIHGKVPIIYGGPTLTDAVALRWKGQLCENGKVLAFNNVFPEFNHNELVGWSDQIKSISAHLVVIVLRDFDDHPQVKARMDIVKGIIETFEVEVIEIYSRGDMPLDRMFSLIQLGDFVSYYLAILNDVDPTPVKIIDFLKKALTDKQKINPPERPSVS